ncbi:MAG TPA: O-antigen ligase family protein, partial [Bacteroidia bacterium]|nr:O-antigen ligase family protein [Bacteroidia bacterium]
PFERLSNAFKTASSANVDKTSVESTAVRMLIWGESMEIIKNNFWWGVGVGDANDVLQAAYKEHGLTGALEHNLNTHNQYFQTFIG